MFGKMMNRYYYGKSGKGDYTKEDLPQTRWQLFWEMLRVRLSGLIRLNLMYAVAWLPAIFVIGRGLLLWYAGLANVADAQMQLEAGEITAEALAEMTQSYTQGMSTIIMQTLLLLVPCLALTGPFTTGVAYVTRNWARLIMTIGRLPMTVGLKLLSLLPWVIAALVALFTPYMQYALMGLALYYIVIGFGLSRFVGASYSNAVFDRYINPNIEGVQVGRGLYNAQDDEDEEDDGGEAGE